MNFQHFGSSPRGSRCDTPAEPVAVVGIGCRFPGGVSDAGSYWRLLRDGVDAITRTPEDRWNLGRFFQAGAVRRGKTQSRWGGYVDDIAHFDPQLFGVSPKEAASMDPQQRMLLEVSWRALEDAGQPLSQVAGRPVSVFVGISSFDYAVAGLSFRDRCEISPYSNTGGSSSIAANRISYCFDLRGPSVAVDTACSSSLVALHLACESLGRGESEMALVGGVNALLLPDFYVAFSQLGVLSPDGRCRSFDARANGYVRSEGAGMVLLKPLREAIRDGNSIYCVIRGTALNQDGHTPGLTVPSREAQRELASLACARAGCDPSDVQYVEAHGTGTAIGDPIEAAALADVFCTDRDADKPCRIGSVKTNLGHLEAGAGMASLIKVALSLQQRSIPAHLHFERPNPEIDFESLKLRVPAQTEAWESPSQSRLAGINGFGYGGANAHVLVEQAPSTSNGSVHSRLLPDLNQESRRTSKAESDAGTILAEGDLRHHVLPLSARNSTALGELAGDIAGWLENGSSGFSMADVAAWSAHHRNHLEHRRAIVGSSIRDWVEQLRQTGPDNSGSLIQVTQAAARSDGARGCSQPLFVCCGQGPQWWGMGRGLYQTNSVYRRVVERCDREFAKHADWSLQRELECDASESRMHETALAQPALFALQIALAECWARVGVVPGAVVGHSVGEIAAAFIAGALTFEDACLVAVQRGRTMDLASSRGAMLAAGMSANDALQLIERLEVDVSLAAVNGPTSVTLSGAAAEVDPVARVLESEGVFFKRLAVDYAFHSRQMAPVRDELLRCLAELRPRATAIDMISTVTGEPIAGDELDADYWWSNVREGVQFADAMSFAADEGHSIAIELGPHPTLAFSMNECFQAKDRRISTIASLRRDRSDEACFLAAIACLYELGANVDWNGLYSYPARKVPLPPYPFQRQELWVESEESRRTRLAEPTDALLGDRVDTSTPTWQVRLDLSVQTSLGDHRVRNACMLPAAAMIDAAAAASRRLSASGTLTLSEFCFHRACLLDEAAARWLECVYDSDLKKLTFSSREVSGDEWAELASVVILKDALEAVPLADSLDEVASRCTEPVDQRRCYDYCDRLGLQYGPSFRGVVEGIRRDGESLVKVSLPPTDSQTEQTTAIDAALLDSCFHSMIVADKLFDHALGGLYLPKRIGQVQILRPIGHRAIVHARLVDKNARRSVAHLDVYDDELRPCVRIRDFVSERVGQNGEEKIDDWLYRYVWQRAELEPEGIVALENRSATQWCVFADRSGVADQLIDRLRERGERVLRVDHGASTRQINDDHYELDATCKDDFLTVVAELSDDRRADRSHIVYLWGLDTPAATELSLERLRASSVLTTLAPLYLVQSWEKGGASTGSDRLTIITQGAQTLEDGAEPVEVAQMPLIGFGRVIVSECAAFRTRLVDIGRETTAVTCQGLLAELCEQDDLEDEVMHRDGYRYAQRFAKHFDHPLGAKSATGLSNRLGIGRVHGIDELRYTSMSRAPLAPQEVEIEVSSTGLNFSDVMKSLNLYPGVADERVELGAECCGRVTRVGSGVTEFSVGDTVIAVAPGSFATHVHVDADLVARKPECLSDAEAATIPIAFLTAEHALHECGRIREGDRVLIHSASGGVGLAAMQIAQAAGATVFATAGSEAKRSFVSELGAAHVMDSRTLTFADEILETTAGEGVDLVLNSLPGEAITQGLRCLKAGGRFLEIGKRDIHDDSPLGLSPFRNNLAFFAIDLDQLCKLRPQQIGQRLRALVSRFERGELHPLPVRIWDADQTDTAFRFMQQAKHVGKVAVSYNSSPTTSYPGTHDSISFRPDGTYWIAGGLGGFGLEVASWLSRCGAGTVVLSGRRQTPDPEAERAIKALESAGTRVRVLAADIADRTAVDRVLHTIATELDPLCGVFHTAMVLEDRLLQDLDHETLERVLRPKMLGGWNLHLATAERELDHFVLFSSLSSVFGHAGQANYSAANAFLDGLAHYRRAQGLTACAINWGHLGEVGYLARRQDLSDRLERQGVLSFSVRQAMESLSHALESRATQLSMLRIDWEVWRGLGITGRISPRFKHLVRNSSNPGDASLSPEELRGAEAGHRDQLIQQMLGEKLESLLGFSSGDLEVNRSLLELGIDSLMAVELRNWTESRIGVSLPVSELMQGASVLQLTESISAMLNQTTESDAAPRHGGETPAERLDSEQASSLLETLPQMPQQEVSVLLAQMLREQEASSDDPA